MYRRISDLRHAAEILKGKHVKKGIRVIVFPATQAIYLEALKDGTLSTLVEAGCVISAPTCGPCLGGHMGILAEGERCVSTTTETLSDVWDTLTVKFILQVLKLRPQVL